MLKWKSLNNEGDLIAETPLGEFTIGEIHRDTFLVVHRYIKDGQLEDEVLTEEDNLFDAKRTAQLNYDGIVQTL